MRLRGRIPGGVCLTVNVDEDAKHSDEQKQTRPGPIKRRGTPKAVDAASPYPARSPSAALGQQLEGLSVKSPAGAGAGAVATDPAGHGAGNDAVVQERRSRLRRLLDRLRLRRRRRKVRTGVAVQPAGPAAAEGGPGPSPTVIMHRDTKTPPSVGAPVAAAPKRRKRHRLHEHVANAREAEDGPAAAGPAPAAPAAVDAPQEPRRDADGDVEMDLGGMSDEQAMMVGVFGAETIELLQSHSWEERRQGLREVEAHLMMTTAKRSRDDHVNQFEAATFVLATTLQDKTNPVYLLSLQMLANLVESGSDNLSQDRVRTSLAPLLGYVVKKAGASNARLRDGSIDTLITLADNHKLGFGWVQPNLFMPLKNKSNVTEVEGRTALLARFLNDTPDELDLVPFLMFCQPLVEQGSARIRLAAVKVMQAVLRQAKERGSLYSALVAKLSPASRKALNMEQPGANSSPPKRTSRQKLPPLRSPSVEQLAMDDAFRKSKSSVSWAIGDTQSFPSRKPEQPSRAERQKLRKQRSSFRSTFSAEEEAEMDVIAE